MNGRVYDPELGRFLSADPLIQFPESTQGFDRYAYVGNSPLSYTDPSGHGWLSVLGAIVSVAFPQFSLLGKFMIAVDGYMEGGLQGALFSVASMAAAAGVGDAFGPVGNFGNELARAAVHGLIQGALGVAQGGKFGAAFMSAAVTSGYGSKFGQMGNRVQRVIGAAVLGGTVSRIGGGKFANGAVTGAFVQAFASRGGEEQGGAPDDASNSQSSSRRIASDVDGDGKVDITFNNDVPGGPSPDRLVTDKVATLVEDVVRDTGFDINVNSTVRPCSGSAHCWGNAVDINRINGMRVDDPANLPNVVKLQMAIQVHPFVRENYGPAMNLKSVPFFTLDRSTNATIVDLHRNHVHVSGSF